MCSTWVPSRERCAVTLTHFVGLACPHRGHGSFLMRHQFGNSLNEEVTSLVF
jgi:hypothetical protein